VDCAATKSIKLEESLLYGVIDIGSNTIRLMIYRVEAGVIHPVLNNKYPAGLAGYITSKNKMSGEGIDKLIEILEELRTVTEQITLEDIFPFGTASFRNITNAEEVLDVIKNRTGFDVQVLSGIEEAEFDYYGALQSTPLDSGLLVDVGGGSTELVLFKDRKAITTASMPIGSLNLYTRFVTGILPSRYEIRRIESEVSAHLEEVTMPIGAVCGQLCTVGGTARAALKLYEGIKGNVKNGYYNSDVYDDYLSQIASGPERLMRRILKTSPERIHTLTPGIAVLRTISVTYGIRPVVTSNYGVREGYLYYILKKRGIIDEAEL
jgi:exopolyphosphatase/guanosine-5'-triphosphate,3'-diphosphate pyrophosphatase